MPRRYLVYRLSDGILTSEWHAPGMEKLYDEGRLTLWQGPIQACAADTALDPVLAHGRAQEAVALAGAYRAAYAAIAETGARSVKVSATSAEPAVAAVAVAEARRAIAAHPGLAVRLVLPEGTPEGPYRAALATLARA